MGRPRHPARLRAHFAQASGRFEANPARVRVSSEALVRVVALCVVLACAETLHGIARIKLLIPRVGKERAIKLSAVTGTLLAAAICSALVPGIGLQSAGAHLALGCVLAAFMAAFDIALGRWLLRKGWAKIWPDFDPRTGNYLLYGLMALCVIPMGVWLLAGPWAR